MRLVSNSPDSGEHARAWYRGSKRLIAFSLCTAFVFVFVGVSLVNQASPKINLTSFNCCLFSGNQTFSINVEVELSNGMDQNEAINVATNALNKILVINLNEQIESFGSSANLDPGGVWTVRLNWMMRMRGRAHAGLDISMT